MTIADQIETTIKQDLQVAYFELINESHMHVGNAKESHFKLVLVSDDFTKFSKVKRHQLVYKSLVDIMPTFHALALHIYTQSEWQVLDKIPVSSQCAGNR
jgi:BolA protein